VLVDCLKLILEYISKLGVFAAVYEACDVQNLKVSGHASCRHAEGKTSFHNHQDSNTRQSARPKICTHHATARSQTGPEHSYIHVTREV